MSQLADFEPTPRAGPSFALLESKLHAPLARPTLVLRTALVERIAGAPDVPVITIVAPPGYGKTTLLTQFADHIGPRVAWLSLDDGDNDPEILLSYVVAALDRVAPIDPDVYRLIKRRGLSTASTAARRLAAAMQSMPEPVVLCLDHVEFVHNPECLDAIAALAIGLPSGCRLAMASRTTPPIPLTRMRASGALIEIGVDDLAMDPIASQTLLIRAGVDLGDRDDAGIGGADRRLAGRPLPRCARAPRGRRRSGRWPALLR